MTVSAARGNGFVNVKGEIIDRTRNRSSCGGRWSTGFKSIHPYRDSGPAKHDEGETIRIIRRKESSFSMDRTCVNIHSAQIRGFISASGVANYLGVPYGKIPERFRPARLADIEETRDPERLVIEAAGYGPRCPQPFNGGRLRRAHLYEGTTPSTTTSAVDDEFDCLTLNIYAPPNSASSGTKIPVLVYIHGGGFVFGDGNSDYDGNFLVREATSSGKPFVFVSVNYRLGYFGFLSSRELKAEAARHGEDYQPNLGLYDQRLGLQWVQKYIEYFGGDPNHVTITGQSAGAWAALSHVVSNVNVGQRGLIMSGLACSFPAADEAQDAFDNLVASTGVSASASDEEKLAALRKLSYDQMAELLNGSILVRPAWDSKWFAYQDKPTRLEQITFFPPWIREVAIGWTKDETSLMKPLWQSWSVDQVREIVRQSVPDDAALAEEIVEAYGMSNANSPDAVLKGLLQMTAESFYGLLPPTVGEVGSPPVNLFRLEQADPYDQSIYQGYAYHCLDTVLLCRMPAVAGPHAPKDLQLSTDAMTRMVTSFIHGQRPLDAFRETGKVFILNGSKTGAVEWPRTETWRRFTSTETRARRFVDAGRYIMTYNVNAFYKKK